MHEMISHASNREDVLLVRAFGTHIGFYVDVGANDPREGSTTRALYDRGWRGINIEPNPTLHAKLVVDRPGDTNICAVATDAPGTVPFFVVQEDPALSTIDKTIAENYSGSGLLVNEIEVKALKLDTVLEAHASFGEIDVLKIDVEGAEENVLRGFDLKRWHPRVLIIEAVAPKRFEKTHSGWESLFDCSGYSLALFDGVNRFYVRSDEDQLAEALSWPVCSLDRYSTAESLELAQYRQLGRVARTAARFTQFTVGSVKHFFGIK